ncbi:MAG: TATA-box-binding protein [Candidatus Jordarchaeum sp.]|uniref:TATA-box-binding protein n=1 Tax=Candidatus Jordarchaeum sp. TaxID=2823881 RepID=UPI00404998A7
MENVVASVKINQKIDLTKIAQKNPNSEYNPEQFPGLVYRINDPKTATLIFSSGRMVSTGAKSVKEVHKAVNKIVQELQKIGVLADKIEPEIEIQNVVASASLGAELNLELAAYTLSDVIYEPEQFPGLIYRMKDPKVVILLFTTGKLVITGAKKEEYIRTSVEKLLQTVTELGIIKTKWGD